ncbi:hypothetical protein Dda_8260 [Drechslerella dactyloides]|uniref:F-box domain-containing protein n=1 Tax=Drechslerella dactyloides TaxID=74499 RepID=A0AAD6IV48_DREDA|nr:hypothetical protein Dda_8260 [Drechslerella dactyloides]
MALNRLTALPFELLVEVATNLDKASLKALRIACPTSKISAVTRPLLFRTIVLRLGTLEWTLNWATSRFPYLETLQDEASSSTSIFAECRKLFIDTRYPFAVTADRSIARRDEVDRLGIQAFDDDLIDPLRIDIEEVEQGAFLKLLRAVHSAAKGLRTVEWRTTDDAPFDMHKGICELLFNPDAAKNYTLDVAITVTPSDGPPYLEKLSNINFLAIKIAARRRSEFNPSGEFQTAGAVVKRCPNLRGFEFYSKAAVFTYETSEPLRAPLNNIAEPTLEIFKADSNLGFTHGLKWNKLRNVKQLWISGDSSITYVQDLTELFNGFDSVGASLDRLSIENYNEPIHNYLVRGNSTLADLELWGFWKNERLGVRFWEEVIPHHAPTLRRLKIHNLSNPRIWSWLNYQDNLAKKNLRKCIHLEDLTISFCDGHKCFLPDLIEDLVPVCPRLHTISLVYNLYTPKGGIEATTLALNSWSSTDSSIFDGRAITLRYEDPYKGCMCFGRKSPDDEIPDLWFDRLVQTWRLVRSDGVYTFDRQNDIYLTDDKLAWTR